MTNSGERVKRVKESKSETVKEWKSSIVEMQNADDMSVRITLLHFSTLTLFDPL